MAASFETAVESKLRDLKEWLVAEHRRAGGRSKAKDRKRGSTSSEASHVSNASHASHLSNASHASHAESRASTRTPESHGSWNKHVLPHFQDAEDDGTVESFDYASEQAEKREFVPPLPDTEPDFHLHKTWAGDDAKEAVQRTITAASYVRGQTRRSQFHQPTWMKAHTVSKSLLARAMIDPLSLRSFAWDM